MTPEQRQALTESLAHWEENVRLAEQGMDIETGPNVCACCRLWIENWCKGCPIVVVTGREFCRDTFYWIVCKCLLDGGWEAKTNEELEAKTNEELIEACRLERDWLKLILDSEVDDNG